MADSPGRCLVRVKVRVRVRARVRVRFAGTVPPKLIAKSGQPQSLHLVGVRIRVRVRVGVRVRDRVIYP